VAQAGPDGIRIGWGRGGGCDVRDRDRFRKYLDGGQSQGALIGRFASRQCIPLGALGGLEERMGVSVRR
jgi:hypothetical protein